MVCCGASVSGASEVGSIDSDMESEGKILQNRWICALRVSGWPSFQKTMSAREIFSSTGSWAASTDSISSSFQPLRALSLATWVARVVAMVIA